MEPPETQKWRSPDLLAQDEASEGIEALPRRVERYGKAKKRALDVAHFMEDQGGELGQLAKRLRGCGEYLLFRHYYTVDRVRLHAACFCRKHLLCPLCAIRRGSKSLRAYLDRWEIIQREEPELRPFLITLTVKDGADLRERFRHLHKSQRELWMRKHRGRGCVLDGVAGAVWSYEFKRGKGSKLWHPHLHMIALAEAAPSAQRLSQEWHAVTGDSFIVDVRPITGATVDDQARGFLEVFKYAVKFADQEPADTVHAFQVLKGRRLLESAGAFRGVEVPQELTDEPLDGLPYVELFYRFLGAGYGLSRDCQAA